MITARFAFLFCAASSVVSFEETFAGRP